jgi:hypothetical protein
MTHVCSELCDFIHLGVIFAWCMAHLWGKPLWVSSILVQSMFNVQWSLWVSSILVWYLCDVWHMCEVNSLRFHWSHCKTNVVYKAHVWDQLLRFHPFQWKTYVVCDTSVTSTLCDFIHSNLNYICDRLYMTHVWAKLCGFHPCKTKIYLH